MKYLAKWTAPEYDHHEKEVLWYWGSIIIAIIIFALSLWQKNYFFAFFVIVAEILVIIWSSRVPSEITFPLSQKELIINDDIIYRFEDMTSFGINENLDPELPRIHFILKQKLRPPIIVNIRKTDADEVVNTLSARLPKVVVEPSLSDSTQKFLRF